MKPLDILTLEKYSKDNQPLFKSQTVLADLLIKSNGGPFKNNTSARAFINQAFNGKKKLSDNVAQAIFKLIEFRLNDKINFDELKVNIINSFEENFKKNIQLDEYDQLKYSYDIADTILVVTPKPAELQGNRESKEMVRKLLESLEVIGEKNHTRKKKYEFYFPKRESSIKEPRSIVFKFWEGLCIYLKEETTMTMAEIFEKLININNSIKPPFLKTYETDPTYSWLHIAVINLEISSEKAYILCNYDDRIAKTQRTSVARFEGYSFDYWKEHLYLEMKNVEIGQNKEKSKGEVKTQEMKFENFKKDIEDTIFIT